MDKLITLTQQEANAVSAILAEVLERARLNNSGTGFEVGNFKLPTIMLLIDNARSALLKIDSADGGIDDEAAQQKAAEAKREKEEKEKADRIFDALREAFPNIKNTSWGNDERIYSAEIGTTKIWFPYWDETDFIVEFDYQIDDYKPIHFDSLVNVIICIQRRNKEFFVRDNSGRGNHYTTTGERLIDYDYVPDEEADDYEDSLNYFIDNAEIGDEFQNDNSTVTRTK